MRPGLSTHLNTSESRDVYDGESAPESDTPRGERANDRVTNKSQSRHLHRVEQVDLEGVKKKRKRSEKEAKKKRNRSGKEAKKKRNDRNEMNETK